MNRGTRRTIARWILVLAATSGLFYALDQALMSAQGLPLDWNMAPHN